MKTKNRINYGGGLIRESENWREKHPLGPVHWDVWNGASGELIGESVPANALQTFMSEKKLLFIW